MRTALAEYSLHGNITLAAQAAGIHRETWRDWIAKSQDEPPDPAFCLEVPELGLVGFAQAARVAQEEARDRLVAEVRRRAVDGVEEPVFYQGVEVSRVRKYSDLLLMFLLKQVDHSFRDNHRVEVEHTGRVEIDSARDRLAAKLEAALLARAEQQGLPAPGPQAPVIDVAAESVTVQNP